MAVAGVDSAVSGARSESRSQIDARGAFAKFRVIMASVGSRQCHFGMGFPEHLSSTFGLWTIVSEECDQGMYNTGCLAHCLNKVFHSLESSTARWFRYDAKWSS